MHKRIYGLFVLSAAIILASCSQQPIFWAIEREIELEEPAIRGNVYSVVRCGNDLYAANGNVYKKSLKSERRWTEVSKPGGSRVIQLASNNTYLYALDAQTSSGTAKYQVWVLSSVDGNWQKISEASGSDVVIFDNGDVNAYVRVNENVKTLNGTTTLAPPLWAATNGAGAKTVAAVRFGSEDYFWNTRAFCKDGTNLYSADGKIIKHSTTFANLAAASANTSVQTSETITCLIHVQDGTNEYLIAGTKKGLEQIILEGGVPKRAGILGSNAEAAFGESEIFCVAFFRDGPNYAIYAGAGKASASKHNALWAYYPSRGDWNYE